MLFKKFEKQVCTLQLRAPQEFPEVGLYSASIVLVDGKERSQFFLASSEQCLEPPDHHRPERNVLYNAVFEYAEPSGEGQEPLSEPLLLVVYRPWITRMFRHEGKAQSLAGPLMQLAVRERDVMMVIAVAEPPPEEEMALLLALRNRQPQPEPSKIIL